MGSKFELAQVVKINDGKSSGTVDAVWLARSDSPQYLVTWWDDGHRHQQWLREHEIVAA